MATEPGLDKSGHTRRTKGKEQQLLLVGVGTSKVSDRNVQKDLEIDNPTKADLRSEGFRVWSGSAATAHVNRKLGRVHMNVDLIEVLISSRPSGR